MKKYKNSDIIIEWQPERCQHSGICIRILPEVYNLKKTLDQYGSSINY